MNNGSDKRHDNNMELGNSEEIIIGRNPVIEALKSGNSINKILIAGGEKKGSINEIISLSKQHHVVVQEVKMALLDKISGGTSHQGVIAYVPPFSYVDVETIIQIAKDRNEPAFILIADSITDPHNLGALIRTAEALGAHGIIIPKRNAVAVNSTVAKTSAGAVEYLAVARETNISRCIEFLKKQGVWVVGADAAGKQNLHDVDLKGPIALVVGGEDKGIGRLVRDNCDFIVRIPMKGKISSLNASVAGAMLMYETARQRAFR